MRWRNAYRIADDHEIDVIRIETEGFYTVKPTVGVTPVPYVMAGKFAGNAPEYAPPVASKDPCIVEKLPAA